MKGGLIELTQQDLSVFSKLKKCAMWTNALVSLNKDLFEKNLELVPVINWYQSEATFWSL
jgi:hypothetical protein